MKQQDQKAKAQTFQKARTTRRMARRRGWQVPPGEPKRDTDGSFYPTGMRLSYSLDSKPRKSRQEAAR